MANGKKYPSGVKFGPKPTKKESRKRNRSWKKMVRKLKKKKK